ncbi:MAG: nucleotidyltransferase family protein [Boseongicola sp. SB0676_bin_33]|nr:nucleotidyltransferase family protein [Boseongicola sp. SB0676_bin_33]MYK32737.1 nucleotidyltransferase family protein [Boseongicola sp. SB0670_bin_30]
MTRPRSAMIFAAGFGTRMGDLCRDMPKPMVPFAGRPMISHCIGLLRDAGITTIVANTHHLPHGIEPFLRSEGIAISRERPDILETGGGLKAAVPLLGAAPVITINPDAAWLGCNPVKALIDTWRPEMRALLALVPQSSAHGTSSVGDFRLEDGRVRRGGALIYGGAQVIRTDQLDRVAEKVFSLNVYWDLLSEEEDLHGLVYDGNWCDLGHPAGLRIAEGLACHV